MTVSTFCSPPKARSLEEVTTAIDADERFVLTRQNVRKFCALGMKTWNKSQIPKEILRMEPQRTSSVSMIQKFAA